MIPAHLDKSSTSLLSNLGFIPAGQPLHLGAELKEMSNLHRAAGSQPLSGGMQHRQQLDAHYLEQINQANYHHPGPPDGPYRTFWPP